MTSGNEGIGWGGCGCLGGLKGASRWAKDCDVSTTVNGVNAERNE
ncbi:hypothetical protein HSB1_19130 [Halogranum salarium B-1]|uniref:Uncharacterized protein n=1 Tax=Halogranum salarium B-1 TaxID=1210908 RepID=J2ZGF1_9EURY|nr:hypothetical protein HSB1_19130 [Halogranum salarium B-1]